MPCSLHITQTLDMKERGRKGMGRIMGGRCCVSLVRLHSFACDDMHSKAIDSQSGFLFLKEKEGIVKFMAVRDHRYEDIKSMFLTFRSSANHFLFSLNVLCI